MSIELLARDGDAAVGTNTVFADLKFSLPRVNSTGTVAFHGRTNEPANGIWRSIDGVTSLMILSGQDAPGFVSEGGFQRTFGVIGREPSINDATELSFTAEIAFAGERSTR